MADTPPTASIGNAFGHSRCLLCGESNPASLKLAFTLAQDGSVKARFECKPGLQGYDGILHGGVTASLLDAAMTHCLFHHGIKALTADLHVRYTHAIACDARLDLWAAITSRRPPLYQLRAEVSEEGRLMAWAEAKFLLRSEAAPWPGA